LYIINPLLSYQTKKSSLRKVKTDAIDAYHLCKLFYKEELEAYKKRGVQLLNLRNLTIRSYLTMNFFNVGLM
jgi:transposase